jgi:hypothetical protein
MQEVKEAPKEASTKNKYRVMNTLGVRTTAELIRFTVKTGLV